MTTLPEPPDGTILLICHPITGQAEDAWQRDDAAARDGYGDQHWYPIGRAASEYPETWAALTAHARSARLKIVTATKDLNPQPPLV